MVTLKEFKEFNKEEHKILKDMIFNYLNELHEINSNISAKTREEIEELYVKDTYIYLLTYYGEIIGFAFIGYNSNCHENVDIYIAEFYIVPKMRGKTLGKEAVKEILKRHSPRNVCLYILENNQVAYYFWDTVFITNGYKLNTINYITDSVSDLSYLEWYVYEEPYISSFRRGKKYAK